MVMQPPRKEADFQNTIPPESGERTVHTHTGASSSQQTDSSIEVFANTKSPFPVPGLFQTSLVDGSWSC